MPQSECEPGLHGVTIIVTEHCFASFSEDGAVDVTVMAQRQKKQKNTAFIKTMPHHRKPCASRTNTPPCFITAVSSHWCSHREICLDASAGSAVENSPPPRQTAKHVVVGCRVCLLHRDLYLTIVSARVWEDWAQCIFTFLVKRHPPRTYISNWRQCDGDFDILFLFS